MTMPNENESGRSAPSAALSDPETLCEEIESYITEKPFQSLALALLAGILVGKIIL